MNKFLRRGIACTLSLAVAFSGLAISKKTAEPVSADTNYQLVWSDEFEGTSLNRDNWNVEVNGNGGGNNELQYYRDSEENIKVSDGTLKITALKESYNGKNYTSGRINTRNKQSFKYGRIEARIKLPCFQGIWPAFWMLGDSYATEGWPKCGEIDIMEAINAENKVYGTVHWSYQNNHAEAGGNLSNVDRTQWHVYAIEWTQTQIKWYCDDVNFYTQSISDAAEMQEFKAKHFIIFNVAVGGNWPGFTVDDSYFPDSSTMEVDYVRVYQHQKEEYTGPTVTITDDVVASTTSNWESYFGSDWQGGSGTATLNGTAADGITMNVTAAGSANYGDESRWGIQATLSSLTCYPGNTYTYNCTITSDKDKVVFVKVADDLDTELAGEYITLKAGVPYNYSKEVEVPDDYEGALKLAFGLGKCNGDTIGDDEGFNLTISDVSLKVTATIPEDQVPDHLKPSTPSQDTNGTTTNTNSNTNTNVNTNTTVGSETTAQTVKKPARAKIKRAYAKKKAAKLVKIKIKKVKGAKGYQVQISKAKKFKKKNLLVRRNVKKLKPVIKSKKLKNKKKLYVRVRAYVLDTNGKKIYGKWSKVKKVRIK